MKLKCDNCHNCFQVNDEDINRINNALNKGLNMILIHCSKCNKRTTWYPAIEECYEDTSSLTRKDFSKNDLPKEYLNFLRNNKEKKIKIFDNEECFNLYSKKELMEFVNIDGTLYYQMSAIIGYIRVISEVAYDDIKHNIDILKNSISIGYENSRILFIDSRLENSFLYIFHPDGGDIEKTFLTISDIVNNKNNMPNGLYQMCR